MSRSIHQRLLALTLCLCLMLACLPVFTVSAAQGDEFDAMREKFFSMAVGGEYDATDERYAPMIESINDTAQGYWDSMNKNPVCNTSNGRYTGMAASTYENDYIFPAYPLGLRDGFETYDCSNSLQFTFQYLRAMALAYQTEGCELYQNEELLEDILNAVEYMCTYHFNTSMANYGAQGYGNWFAWQLGAPIYLGETLMLLYDEFTPEQIKEYATTMIHFLARRTMSGANGTWAERVRMYAGILLKDANWLTFVKNSMPGLLKYTTSGDGYYVDGTFVQHGNITYNGGYGLMILTDSVFIQNLLADSTWALDSSSTDIMYQFAYDTYAPAVYEGLMLDAFRGREITRQDTTQARGGILVANAFLMLAENAPADIAADFRGMVKQWFDSDFMMDELFHSADTPWFKFPMDTAVKIVNLLDDDSVEPYDFSGRNVQMVSGARTVHFGDDFAFTVSMANKKIATYEAGDSNNKGWYTGNGMTNLITESDLARYEGVNKATIDWYRLPGTTASYGKSQGALRYNQNSFVGGVTNGAFGVTGMDMAFSDNAIKAKKSWFMFDDEVVALGSNISGQGAIETTIDNLMLGENNRAFSVNGQAYDITLDGNTNVYAGAETLHIQGNNAGSDIGVYLPGGGDVSIKSESRTGTWAELGFYNTDETEQSADYLTAWFAHGNNPTNGKYAYVLLPGKTSAQTESYADGSDIEILRQDDKIHAVYEKTTGTLGACFWANGAPALAFGGSENYLRVDQAATVMVTENEDGIHIALSDPTMENNGEITVELDRAVLGAASLDENVELIQTYPTTKVKFSTHSVVGETLNAYLSFDEVTLPEEVEPSTTVNLALGKVASSSANDPNNGALTPNLAVDGDRSTRWASGRNDAQWFIVDLGTTCTVEAINILWETAAGKEYKVQISDDLNTWTDMVHETAGAAGLKEYTLSQSFTGRYVRMLGISRTTNYGYSMYEFEVWGTVGAGETLPITAIELPATLSMVQGERQTLAATVTPATSAAIGWKSSDDKLLAINAAGVAVALADAGEVTVTAYAMDDESIKAQCKITLHPNPDIPVPVTGITIDGAPKDAIAAGTTCELTATVAPADATYTAVKWSSSDESVAIVNADGIVTAIGEGEVTITAQSVTSEQSATVKIAVGKSEDQPPVTTVDKTELEALLADAKAVDRTDVAEEKLTALDNAITAAQTVIDNENATQTAVDMAQTLLQNALEAIKADDGDDPDDPVDPILPGDVDESGVVDVADIMMLKGLIMGESWTPEQFERGNLDGDETLSVADIMGIKNIIMRG